MTTCYLTIQLYQCLTNTPLPPGHHDFLLEDRHAGAGTVGHDIGLALADLGVGTSGQPDGETCRKLRVSKMDEVCFFKCTAIILNSEGKLTCWRVGSLVSRRWRFLFATWFSVHAFQLRCLKGSEKFVQHQFTFDWKVQANCQTQPVTSKKPETTLFNIFEKQSCRAVGKSLAGLHLWDGPHSKLPRTWRWCRTRWACRTSEVMV